jgi:FixJ family two-component response regulator
VTETATVYVVDDDDSVRAGLSRLLRAVGHQVETFDSAVAFLARRDEITGPACLVLDVMMPEMTGLELQDQLRALASQIPIIFVSGHASVPVAVRALTRGASTFLEKPVDPEQLVDAVKTCLASHAELLETDGVLNSVRQRYDSLSPREREVLGHVVTGLLNKQTAVKMGISEKTVKVHRARVMEKMEADSVADLVRLAERIGVGPGIS